MVTKRVDLFDTTKFLLIFLVVYGHMLQPYREISYNSELYSLIYSFHMPLFIIISGYFSKRKQEREVFIRDSLRLLETFVFLHLLSIVYELLSQGDINLSKILVPGFASWYILCLLIWRCVLRFIPDKWLEAPYYCFLLTIVVSLSAGYIPVGGVLAIQRSFSMFPFFILGFLLNKYNCFNRIKVKSIFGLLFLLIFVIVVFRYNNIGDMGDGNNEFHNVMHCTYHYYKGKDFISHPLFYRFLYILLSTIISFAVISVIPRHNLGFVTEEGRFTLFYYFWHSIVFNMILVAFSFASVENNSFSLFVGSILVMFILYSIRKSRILKMLMNPISSLCKII